jgi:hypothetical protein
MEQTRKKRKVSVTSEEWYQRVRFIESNYQAEYDGNLLAQRESWEKLIQLRKQEKHLKQILSQAKDIRVTYSQLKSKKEEEEENGKYIL